MFPDGGPAHHLRLRRGGQYPALGGAVHPHQRIYGLHLPRPVRGYAAINAHWRKEGIRFDAVYTGYLGSARQVADVRQIMRDTFPQAGCASSTRPWATTASSTPASTPMPRPWRRCAAGRDIILPNITEACFMTGAPYPAQGYDEGFIQELLARLTDLGAGSVVLTGVSYAPDQVGVAVYEGG